MSGTSVCYRRVNGQMLQQLGGLDGKQVRIVGKLRQAEQASLMLDTTDDMPVRIMSGVHGNRAGWVECVGVMQQGGLAVVELSELGEDLDKTLMNEAIVMSMVPELAAFFNPEEP